MSTIVPSDICYCLLGVWANSFPIAVDGIESSVTQILDHADLTQITVETKSDALFADISLPISVFSWY